jgi:AcrR family transcriptional regulator
MVLSAASDTNDRRQAILDAALQAIDAKGVLAATLDDIREGSGASIGSIYHHFGDKEGIAAALYAQLLAEWQRGFVAALRNRGAEQGVRAAVDHQLRWAARHPAAIRFLLTFTPPRATLARQNREFFDAVNTWLASHAGEIRQDLDLATGEAVWLGPASEYCRHWLAGNAPKPDRRRRELLADIAWRSLCRTPTKK